MPVRQYGNQSYKFGFADPAALAIAAAVGLQPQSLDVDKDPEFEAEGKNTFAETEAYVKGSAKGGFTMEGYVVDPDLFDQVTEGEVSGTFQYRGRNYIVNGGKLGVKSTEFQMGTMKGVTFKNITDAVGTALN